MFLLQDENVLYIETEEEFEKPKFRLTGEAKEALKNYYDAAHIYVQHRQALLKPPRNLKVRSKIKLFS